MELTKLDTARLCDVTMVNRNADTTIHVRCQRKGSLILDNRVVLCDDHAINHFEHEYGIARELSDVETQRLRRELGIS